MRQATTIQEWEEAVREALLDYREQGHFSSYQQLHDNGAKQITDELAGRGYSKARIRETLQKRLPSSRTIRNFVNGAEICHQRLNTLSALLDVKFQITNWRVY